MNICNEEGIRFKTCTLVSRGTGKQLAYSDDEGLISWMLSCRDKVTVIEPESVRDKLYEIACEMAEKYERKG